MLQGSGCNGSFSLVISLGVVGRGTVSCEHGGALTAVAHDASTQHACGGDR
jgi:hypothetical protein